jgi:flagellar hook-associated protein 1
VLFEGTARPVSFVPTNPLQAGIDGNAVYVDGVNVTGANSPMPVTGGKLAAFQDIRDNVAVHAQRLIDELAAGTIRAFAEKDPTDPPSLPDVEGLFIDPAGLGLPGTPALAGLAGRISINPLGDPAEGGDLHLIRDGGFGGSAYVSNSGGSVGFQARLAQAIAAIDGQSTFDAGAGLGTGISIKEFGSRVSGWIDARRQSAQAENESASARQSRTSDSLQRLTGVSIDQEMAQLLDLEKSYQASSKIMSVVDNMLASLFEAVR